MDATVDTNPVLELDSHMPNPVGALEEKRLPGFATCRPLRCETSYELNCRSGHNPPGLRSNAWSAWYRQAQTRRMDQAGIAAATVLDNRCALCRVSTVVQEECVPGVSGLRRARLPAAGPPFSKSGGHQANAPGEL